MRDGLGMAASKKSAPSVKTTAAAKSKKITAPLEGDIMPASYVGAILEEVRSHVRLLGEGMQGMRESMDRQLSEFRADVDGRFDRVEVRLGRVETDMASFKADVATVKADVASLKTDVAAAKVDLALVKSAVLDVARDVRGQSGRLKRLEDAAE